MNYIKEHKIEMLLLSFILILLLVFIGIFLVLWFGGNGDKYGSRLLGIEEVPIGDNLLNEIEKEIKEEEVVSKVTSNIQGRIINFLITVNDDTAVETAKGLSSIVKKGFDEKELEYYDIQVFILDSGTNEESKYPYIGYKHKTSESFVWSNN